MSDWEIIEDSEWEQTKNKDIQKTKGWKGIGQDLLSLIKNSPEILETLSQNIIEGTPGQIQGITENPKRLPQTLMAGILSGPHALASAPAAIANYLSDKEIINPSLANSIPKAPFTPQELVGLKDEMPGDFLGELIGGFASGGSLGPNAIKGITKEVGKNIKNISEKGSKAFSESEVGKYYRGISNTRTGEVLKEGFKKDLEESKKMYSTAFKSAEEKGVRNIPHNISPQEFTHLKDILPEDYVTKLEKAINNNSFENFHDAQSDLMKFSRMVKERARNNPELSSTVREAGKLAENASKKIQDAMARELMDKGGLDTLFSYMEAGEHYSQNVVPWWDLESIKGSIKEPGQKGYRFPANLPSEAGIKSANAFLTGKGTEFPELIINRKLAAPYGRLFEFLSGVGAFGDVIKQ